MENWRRVWREGLAPQISLSGLAALEAALEVDDHRLVQGVTCSPPVLDAWRDQEALAACALGWCGWQGEGRRTVGAIDAYFERLCIAAGAALDDPAACRHFLNWYDDTPRADMRRELLTEVRLALAGGACAAA